jgi:hypothetical protein
MAAGRSCYAPIHLLQALIHRSSCNVRSAKFACRILHITDLMGPEMLCCPGPALIGNPYM